MGSKTSIPQQAPPTAPVIDEQAQLNAQRQAYLQANKIKTQTQFKKQTPSLVNPPQTTAPATSILGSFNG